MRTFFKWKTKHTKPNRTARLHFDRVTQSCVDERQQRKPEHTQQYSRSLIFNAHIVHRCFCRNARWRGAIFLVSLFSVPFPWCMYVCTTTAAAADDDDIIAWILNVCQMRELFLRFRRFQALDCALLLCSAGVFISYCHLFTEWTFDADVKGYKQHNAIECFFNSLLYSISDSNCVKSQAWSLSLDLIAISFIFLGSWRRTDTNSKWNVWFKLKDRNLLLFFFYLLWKTEKTTIWLNLQMITSTHHHHQWTTKRIQIWMDKVSTIIWLIFKNKQQFNI